MLDEAKKSLESILSQRLSSPFYGTLIISWLIWNWKIIYLTIFISEKNISGTKINYIIANYNDIWHIVWYPLISTAVLLLLLPLVTNGAYWLDLVYNRWRVNKKNLVESKQLLTVEQSINLREQIVNMEKRFETLLTDKDMEIAQLKSVVNNSTSPVISTEESNNFSDSEIAMLVNKIKNNEKLNEAFVLIQDYVLNGYSGLTTDSGLSQEIVTFYISNDIIERTIQDKYIWTDKGKQIFKIIVNETFNF